MWSFLKGGVTNVSAMWKTVFLSDMLVMGLSVCDVQANDVGRNVSPFILPFGGTAAEIGGSSSAEIVHADVGRNVSPSFRFIQAVHPLYSGCPLFVVFPFVLFVVVLHAWCCSCSFLIF
jgi:hypothetical protein